MFFFVSLKKLDNVVEFGLANTGPGMSMCQKFVKVLPTSKSVDKVEVCWSPSWRLNKGLLFVYKKHCRILLNSFPKLPHSEAH